jgi:predicted ATP-grasp superfamily ATP-dependent carboligase
MDRIAGKPPRVVLLGGAYGTLALARSLSEAGLEVRLVTNETRCASFSNAIRKVLRWSGPLNPDAADALERLAQAHGLAGSILIPATDADVRFVAGAHRRLSSLFHVLTCDWEQLRWACDKSLAYARAQELGLGVPRVYGRATIEDRRLPGVRFPLVLKPALRVEENRFTSDRAWRVDDAASFAQRYRDACELVGADHVVAQDLIPGDGRNQLSYAGLWNRGEPVIGFTACRLRQYPPEFGSTSTYVMTQPLADVTAAAETFLRSIGHHGLVEIEFKRDPRDGNLNLLDVNPRPWNWLGLAAASGVRLGAAIDAMARGQPVRQADARAGVAWMFAARDIASAARSGRLHPRAIAPYAASWMRVRKFACFEWADPVPGLVDIPGTLVRMAWRRVKGAPVASARRPA